jgi:hypothetical protein
MSTLDDLTTYLQTAGVGTVGTDLFQGFMPGTPNNAVCVIATGGPQPNPDIPLRSPTFQVLIRSSVYATGETKLALVRATLHQLANTQMGSTYFYYILAISEGGYIGRDTAGLDEFSINFLCLTR